MSHRNYIMTWNNPPDGAQEVLENLFSKLKPTYLIG